MLYRATTSFSGLANMAMGEVKELNLDPAVIADLLKAGYITPVERKQDKPKNPKKGGKK